MRGPQAHIAAGTHGASEWFWMNVYLQVAQELGESVHILKVDTEIEKALASQLRIQGLPTMIFIGMDPEKPALRTEGLLPAQSIKEIVLNELMAPATPAES